MKEELRIVISGGGTGGHIFPAVSIANAIRTLRPDAKILFVGALGRMEMTRVPAAGYEIKGLPVRTDTPSPVAHEHWRAHRLSQKQATGEKNYP